MQIYHNNSIDELKETYHFFQEEHLGVCQERVRQYIFELQKSGFIQVYNATVVKYGIKCRNNPCIKLARNFQPASNKIPSKNEKILTQPQKSLDHSLYIDNNKNISNKSRYTESTILQNEKDKCSQNAEN
ncbi:hypothetical protein A1E_02585 [Rickettsia canadensis str. McKiel]|uniref:Uncharacterized protein n=1 Tax=Rickettsia canadensis (strain McKiel) TaxID=293613 RepID=A8EYM8_RICCK|nr:hypothetical protein [Rickettsia canadensis]ABV73461.1 hypothetical protein A1E_02585 [Rickettsia canadensis str. McKiel]